MCDPVTLGISAALGAAGKIVGGSESYNAAKREAAARNAVLADTLAREKGFAGQNATQLEGNVAHYAPGAQDAQLAAAQGGRTATSVGNMTMDNGSVPFTADAPPAVKSELAKRMLAVHDAAVDRATKSARVGGYGDTWLKNNLATNEADRNIGVTNNFANGEKAILAPQQDAAAAGVYKAPSVWSTLLGGASSATAGAAGAGKGLGNVWSPSGGSAGTMQVGSQYFPSFGA